MTYARSLTFVAVGDPVLIKCFIFVFYCMISVQYNGLLGPLGDTFSYFKSYVKSQHGLVWSLTHTGCISNKLNNLNLEAFRQSSLQKALHSKSNTWRITLFAVLQHCSRYILRRASSHPTDLNTSSCDMTHRVRLWKFSLILYQSIVCWSLSSKRCRCSRFQFLSDSK